MFDNDSDSLAGRGSDRDRVLNAETRRALARAARLVGVVIVGALTALVGLSLAAATAILSAPWQVYVAVTAIIALALPVAVPYAMLRVYGLAHRDVAYVGKRAYREVATEIIALSGTSPASVAFIESTDTDETADSISHSPVEDDSDGADPASRAKNQPPRAVSPTKQPTQPDPNND